MRRHVVWPEAGLVHEIAELVGGKWLDEVVDLVVINAVLAKQVGKIAARSTGGFFVDCDLHSNKIA